MQRLLVWLLLKLLHPRWQKKRSILKETRSKKNPPRGCRKRSWTRWGRSWWSSRCRRWDCGNLPPYCLARFQDQPWGETSESGSWAKIWTWKWSRRIKKVDNGQQGRDFVEDICSWERHLDIWTQRQRQNKYKHKHKYLQCWTVELGETSSHL